MLNNHSLFHEPIEELTSVLRGPAVEPECELIQVAIELPPRHRSVMASQQPASVAVRLLLELGAAAKPKRRILMVARKVPKKHERPLRPSST
jgi:hypothetical protein